MTCSVGMLVVAEIAMFTEGQESRNILIRGAITQDFLARTGRKIHTEIARARSLRASKE